RLLAALVEGRDPPGIGGEGHQAAHTPPPLTLRLRAAGLLGAVGDPRLLDPRSGDSAIGAYWCRVEAGPLWHGDERRDEARAHMLPYAFWVGRYPVTNAEYRRFVEAGGYQRREWWSEHGWPYLQASENRFKSNGRQITHPWYWADPEYNQPGQPVVGVSWWEAAAYCAWLTAQGRAAGWLADTAVIRLPTSLEWERAARGDDRRRYPWGDAAPNAERANYEDTALGRPSPAGCFPQGAAASGALDMAGNVMEWLATPEDEPARLTPLQDVDPEAVVLLSQAAFDDDSASLGCGARIESGPFARYLDRGFRLVRGPRGQGQ
ncbi:MAG: formylglycine-generating enzyme family protein, partial [Chloroflexales bacterium]|nr:formylglycine-generating enzyme family protein [Chloroflexales bacterium]